MSDLVKKLNKRQMLSDLQSGLQPDYLCQEAAAEIERLRAQVAALREALGQLLDDMGDDGLCVCQAAKDQARAALEDK